MVYNSDKRPNLFLIGAGKSGTTTLHNLLSRHPDIFMSKIKEPGYFEYKGKDVRQVFYPDGNILNPSFLNEIITNEAEYAALFDAATDQTYLGESTTAYLNGDHALKNIHDFSSDPKFIVILRNPVERLISRWTHLKEVTNSGIGHSPLSSVFHDNRWIERKELLDQGRYYTHLSNFYKLFSRDQLLVLFFEDLNRDISKVLTQVSSFLGIAPFHKVNSEMKYNASGEVKNKLLHKVMGRNSGFIRFIRTRLPKFYSLLSGNKEIKDWINNTRAKNKKAVSIDPLLKKEIYDTFYKQEVEQLEQLLNIDLSHWKY